MPLSAFRNIGAAPRLPSSGGASFCSSSNRSRLDLTASCLWQSSTLKRTHSIQHRITHMRHADTPAVLHLEAHALYPRVDPLTRLCPQPRLRLRWAGVCGQLLQRVGQLVKGRLAGRPVTARPVELFWVPDQTQLATCTCYAQCYACMIITC